ncbi:DUF771 domain-containing protein [Lacticaseibacillus mingshuiensis]|uniref:DUF771 domain-containing protein n=1 Tax=Lacticaseibacillus mingshuiensis TaxID=2799574 RepID=UPI00194FD8D2|nr:DUF771 domain-containing protein [Lacticaseibacillus mingshuiensis]
MEDTINVTVSFPVTVPAYKVLVDRVDWERSTRELLLGDRWTINDIIKKLRGYERGKLTNHVLLPKIVELNACGALVSYPRAQGGDGSRWLFSAPEMAVWLHDNLKQITEGGWQCK